MTKTEPRPALPLIAADEAREAHEGEGHQQPADTDLEAKPETEEVAPGDA